MTNSQLIEEKIQEFNEAQTNISHLVGQQTHFFSSQLEEMYNHAQQHQGKLKWPKNELTNLNQELGKADWKIT